MWKLGHVILILALVALASCEPYPRERQRMAAALEQAEHVYGEGESDTVLFIPELDLASAYYARKGDYGKAALAALYYGYSEQSYNKAAAMESFKMAEQYGELVKDSLTMARAEYQMGKMLLDDYMHQEALTAFNKANVNFDHHYSEKTMVNNAMACCYLLLREYDSAKACLDNSMEYIELGVSVEEKWKLFNNYAVLYRLLGDGEQGVNYLRAAWNVGGIETPLIWYLNMGMAFEAMGNNDSASYYYRLVEANLSDDKARDETRASALGALSRFAERTGELQKALDYSRQREKHLGTIRDRIEHRNIYYIQQKYDHETLQRKMNEKVIQKKQLVLVLSIVLAVLLGFTLILYYRYIQKCLHEVELNDILLRFIEQNKELLKQGEDQEKHQQRIIQQLLELQKEKFKTMQKLDVFLKDRKNVTVLTELEKHLFSGQDHWDVMLQVIDAAYPGLYARIEEEYPCFDETERKVCLLSHFKLARYDEAAILGVSLSVLDKTRGRVRRQMEKKKAENG